MPANSGYMVAAYIATALILGAYVVSLISRARDVGPQRRDRHRHAPVMRGTSPLPAC